MGANDISNRKDARDSLVTALGTIAAFQQVYDYLPKDFENQSPVATVDALSQFPQFEGSALTETFQFAVGVWVRRDTDASAAEDTIDGLGQSVAGVVQDWHNADFFQQSQMDYEMVNGIDYRLEWHFVQVDWE